MPLSPEAFQLRRRPAWDELEGLIGDARGGALRNQPVARLERLGRLYRSTAGDLAIARRDFPGEAITDYLNSLVSRAHPLIHRGAPLRPASIGAFFAVGLPRAFRANGRYVLLSAGLLVAGVAGGWLAVVLRPDVASSIVPSTSLFDKMARGEIPTGTDTGFLQASAIFGNNFRVALLLFVGGVLLGLPTVVSLLFNGWTLGTLAAAEHRDGLDVTFWSFIAPHGIVELTIFVLAGATGLMLADAELRPGLLRRVDAMVRVARDAAGMVVGVATLLVVCGAIEGYLSPSSAPEAVKYTVGVIAGGSLYAWLLLAGRDGTDRRPRPSLDRTAAAVAGE
ncbi:MAG TPA: stage II sporulation protein M [Candidatus Dormibacteraeota bacterium]|nr:stage II sporulation protein M [Candidatus Dormibacteraeota bacterium]